VHLQNDTQLRNSVVNCDIINADGQGVVWASKILGKSIPERVAGIDLMQNLVTLAHQNQYTIFFFWCKRRNCKRIVDKFSKKYSPKIIAGYRNGYFNKDEELNIAQQIADTNANILFVAMGSPKKENFLFENREILKNINFIMGVGGSFDVVAGKVKRAIYLGSKNWDGMVL
jgi:N-acetylglucosaminyldiphosphoundecaprenol N-acetyl-beta-D-mannosaminyltransferase